MRLKLKFIKVICEIKKIFNYSSHIEVGYNWLPPLLAPIKANRRIATVPVIDDFDPNDFSVRAVFAVGDRGGKCDRYF